MDSCYNKVPYHKERDCDLFWGYVLSQVRIENKLSQRGWKQVSKIEWVALNFTTRFRAHNGRSGFIYGDVDCNHLATKWALLLW